MATFNCESYKHGWFIEGNKDGWNVLKVTGTDRNAYKILISQSHGNKSNNVFIYVNNIMKNVRWCMNQCIRLHLPEFPSVLNCVKKRHFQTRWKLWSVQRRFW